MYPEAEAKRQEALQLMKKPITDIDPALYNQFQEKASAVMMKVRHHCSKNILRWCSLLQLILMIQMLLVNWLGMTFRKTQTIPHLLRKVGM